MKKPLYQQVISDLEKKIKNEMKPNDRLPSERQLLKEYGVSRNTIRLALNDLGERGIIYRLHGKGTFVSTIYLDQTNLGSMYSFSEQMSEAGHKPTTQNRTLELVTPEEDVANQLNLKTGEKAYKLVRLRLADGVPLMYGETYLPERIFPDLKMSDLEDNLYTVMKQNIMNKVFLLLKMYKQLTWTKKIAKSWVLSLGMQV